MYIVECMCLRSCESWWGYDKNNSIETVLNTWVVVWIKSLASISHSSLYKSGSGFNNTYERGLVVCKPFKTRHKILILRYSYLIMLCQEYQYHVQWNRR